MKNEESRYQGVLPREPHEIDEREKVLWAGSISLIRSHLGKDETRWPERYQEIVKIYGLLYRGMATSSLESEYERLKMTVLEEAKAWRGTLCVDPARLIAAIERLNAWEAERGSQEQPKERA